jgi:hypothetical protein
MEQSLRLPNNHVVRIPPRGDYRLGAASRRRHTLQPFLSSKGLLGFREIVSTCVTASYRNGERLDEPYVLHDRDYPTDDYRDNFPQVSPSDLDPNIYSVWRTELPSHIQGEDIVVPPNAYLGMGDHRGGSLDSRFWGFIHGKM